MPLCALVHAPSPRMTEAVRTHVTHEPIDLARVESQHAGYLRMLESAGVDVRMIDLNRDSADGVFIEDAAVVLDEVAIVTAMGVASRASEPLRLEPELHRIRSEVARIGPGATLEGGDVLRVGRRLLVGLSGRTSARGVAALAEITQRFGYTIVPVRVSGCLHLKTACTALPDGTLLINPRWIDVGALLRDELLGVHDDEPFAANVVVVNEVVVCTSASHPGTAAELVRRGFDVRTTDLSEIEKAEGGATCLSVIHAP